MIIVSVIYPKTAESNFDLDYYTRYHVPLVRSRWFDLGLQRIDLLHGTSALDGSAAPFEMIAQLTFTSTEHMRDALAKFGDEVMEDIPRFTDITPFFQINEVIS